MCYENLRKLLRETLEEAEACLSEYDGHYSLRDHKNELEEIAALISDAEWQANQLCRGAK